MRCIRAHEFGPPAVLRFEELPDPAAGPGEVRIRVHAVGVNPYDTYMRNGTYAVKPPLPYIPGSDAAGVIDEVGRDVAGLKVGDRVYIGGTSPGRGYGAYASQVVAPVTRVFPLPAGLRFSQGAAIGVPYVTAWRAVFDRARARPGEAILVHGASGGVGLAATQLARAAGLTVIGTAGTEDGMALVRAQGAHHVLNHHDADYMDRLGAIVTGGPDIIIEMLANVNLDRDLGAIARNGRVVIVGNRGRIEIDPRKTMAREASILGMQLWNISEDDVRRIHRGLFALFERSACAPVIGAELPLAQAARAHEQVLEPGARGKIVLLPG